MRVIAKSFEAGADNRPLKPIIGFHLQRLSITMGRVDLMSATISLLLL
jgi:hypothetical protein